MDRRRAGSASYVFETREPLMVNEDVEGEAAAARHSRC